MELGLLVRGMFQGPGMFIFNVHISDITGGIGAFCDGYVPGPGCSFLMYIYLT